MDWKKGKEVNKQGKDRKNIEEVYFIFISFSTWCAIFFCSKMVSNLFTLVLLSLLKMSHGSFFLVLMIFLPRI